MIRMYGPAAGAAVQLGIQGEQVAASGEFCREGRGLNGVDGCPGVSGAEELGGGQGGGGVEGLYRYWLGLIG